MELTHTFTLSSIPESQDPEDYYNMLKKNFDRSYNGRTRAPFGLYVHAAWFFGQDYRFCYSLVLWLYH